MSVREGARGRPVVALLLVLGMWVGARVMLWDAAAMVPVAAELAAEPAEAQVAAGEAAAWGDAAEPGVAPTAEQVGPAAGPALPGTSPMPAPRSYYRRVADAVRPRALAPARAARRGSASPGYRQAGRGLPAFAVAVAAAPLGTAPVRQSLWKAILGQIRHMAAAISAPRAAPFQPPGREPLAPGQAGRWSGDGWLLLRGGGAPALANGAAPSTYGASQAGAVLRYRLAPDSGRRPAVYARTTAALDGVSERELALGFSARPIAAVPVIAAAELRATSQPGGTRLRPTVMAVTELAPFDLPRRFRGEAYAQAGYVGGRYATAFADGQLRVDRGVARLGRAELRAGGGAWGGAQKGASRLDVGPAATMAMGLGRTASARLAVDWRFRVAGDAAPRSGPAVTLSAGF